MNQSQYITLACYSATNYNEDRILVTVGPFIEHFDRMGSGSLPEGGTVNLYWSTLQTTACELGVNGVFTPVPTNVASSAPHSVDITESSLFELRCTDADNNAVSWGLHVTVGYEIAYLYAYIDFYLSDGFAYVYAGWYAEEGLNNCHLSLEHNGFDVINTAVWPQYNHQDDYIGPYSPDSGSITLTCLAPNGATISRTEEVRVFAYN
ncbi:MAG: hypothetical protein H0U74_12190 [Bradymonadaceae bacterium]|nr:hypothetical protein [Lujinxingiaceae bacterium]